MAEDVAMDSAPGDSAPGDSAPGDSAPGDSAPGDSAAPARDARPVALAIGAHPDDIEFHFAGTLLLLADAGWSVHCINLSGGDCGSMVTDNAATRAIRAAEGRAAAALLGATFHESLADDLMIFYEERLLRRLAAVVRRARPRIVLTHALVDYMEDHANTGRLAVTAAFVRGMPNFRTDPPIDPVAGDVTVYHAMPHGLRDPLRQPVVPHLFVDTGSVHERKRRALAAHASQKDWLDATQGMDSYLASCDRMSAAIGSLSGRYAFAEGWRRHLHLGLAARDGDPLADALGPARCHAHPDSPLLLEI
jgi:LmbE family N-acetylglucosaminyl deacetylase